MLRTRGVTPVLLLVTGLTAADETVTVFEQLSPTLTPVEIVVLVVLGIVMVLDVFCTETAMELVTGKVKYLLVLAGKDLGYFLGCLSAELISVVSLLDGLMSVVLFGADLVLSLVRRDGGCLLDATLGG